MKIIIGFLVLSFAHFAYAWKASEKICNDENAIRENLPCDCQITILDDDGKVTDTQIRSLSSCNKEEVSCQGDVIPSESALQRRYEKCDNLISEKKEVEKEEKEAEKEKVENEVAIAEKELENLREKEEAQQRQIQEAKQQCHRESDRLERNVDRIHLKREQIEQRIDALEQRRTELQAMTSDEEDQLQDEYAELKYRTRKLLNQYETDLQTENKRLDNKFIGIQLGIERGLVQLEQQESNKRNACAQRYNLYKIVEDECYKEVLKDVTQKRNQYYTSLYSGEQQFGTVSEVFSNDFEMTEKKFIALLNHEKSRCLDRDIGQTEIVACNLQTLEKRDAFCQKNKNPKCPIGKAANIEQITKKSLSDIHFEIKGLNLELDALYQQLEELPTERKEELARLKRDLEAEKKLYEDQYAAKARDHQKAQLKRFLEIRELTNQINSEMEKDPTLNFMAELKRTSNVCCQPISNATNIMNTVFSNKDGIKEGVTEGIQRFMGGQQMLGDPQRCASLHEFANNAQALQYLFVSRKVDPSTGAVVRIPRTKRSGGGR